MRETSEAPDDVGMQPCPAREVGIAERADERGCALLVSRAFVSAYAGKEGGRGVDLALARIGADAFGTLKAVGRAIYLHSVLAFEVTSLLLLVAVVGAVVVAKGKI